MRRLRGLLAGVLVITLLVGMLPGCRPPGQEEEVLQEAEDMSACRFMRLVAARMPHYDWSLRFLGATDAEIVKIVQLTKDLSVQVCAGPVNPYWTYKEGQKLDEVFQEINTRLAGHLGVSLADAVDISFLVFSSQTEAHDRNCDMPGFEQVLGMSETEFDSLLEDEEAGECDGQAIGTRGDTEWEWADAKADMIFARDWMQGCMDDFMGSRFTGDVCSNPIADDQDTEGIEFTEEEVRAALGEDEDTSSKEKEKKKEEENSNTKKEVAKENEEAKEEAKKREEDQRKQKEALGEWEEGTGTVMQMFGATLAGLALGAAAVGTGGAAAVFLLFDGILILVGGTVLSQDGTDLIYESKTEDCLVYRPTEDIASPFLVDRLGGLDGLENQLFPPTMADAFQHCMCEVSRFSAERSQLNLFNDMGCPSDEDQERLDCLMNPWGPDDGPRLDCLALLEEDSELLKENCSQPVYCLDGILAYSADGENCGCVPHQALIMTLPSSACHTMDCPEGTRCVCETAASCSCGGYVEDHDEIIFNNGFYDPFENIVIAPPIPQPLTEHDHPAEP